VKPAARKAVLGALAVAGVAVLAACHRAEGGSTVQAPTKAGVAPEAIGRLPLGDVAGAAESTIGSTIANPYSGNVEAVAQGHELFVRMNCAGCHGYGATGGMGPNLTDTYWRYGGVPAQIFKSIYEGRPQGMPAWNPALPPDDIWKLVAYIESLGGSFPAKDYQAWVQGDRAGENVPTEVPRTVTPTASEPAASSATAATSPPEARPDAGGKP